MFKSVLRNWQNILKKMNDNELNDLLRAADPAPRETPEFRRSVWRRIEREVQPSFFDRINYLIKTIAHPMPAAVSISAMVAFGMWLGAASAPKTDDAMATYAESVSPFLQHERE